MMCQEGIIKNNLHKPSFTRSFDSTLPPEFRSSVQPLPFGKCHAGEWRRGPKWLIKSHSDAMRASWKIPLMSAVSNVSHRQSHKRQQPSQANYWGRGAAESGPLCEHPSSRWSKAAFCVAGRSASPVRRAEQGRIANDPLSRETMAECGDSTCLSASWMSPYSLKKIRAGEEITFQNRVFFGFILKEIKWTQHQIMNKSHWEHQRQSLGDVCTCVRAHTHTHTHTHGTAEQNKTENKALKPLCRVKYAPADVQDNRRG